MSCCDTWKKKRVVCPSPSSTEPTQELAEKFLDSAYQGEGHVQLIEYAKACLNTFRGDSNKFLCCLHLLRAEFGVRQNAHADGSRIGGAARLRFARAPPTPSGTPLAADVLAHFLS
ncbi:hypothetical protein BASA81_005870 [Batrachochytrium salamandrivorans]|nr:hypothetical protein BASA81_005870 [Batrachochytrium salamandrivorans]